MTHNDDFLAMRYALGVATAEEIKTVKARRDVDGAFSQHLAAIEAVFLTIDQTSDAVVPPPDMWARIEDAIDDLAKPPQAHTIRADSLAWEPFLPGVERKIIFTDRSGIASGCLYRVSAGAEVGSHGHGITEECLVLEGELEIDGVVVRAGDMHIAPPGARHGLLRSARGALVYLRGDAHIQP
ncbi:cupin domain-containing protein [Asticcacaulis sp. YBE204]|uniref:cupin domain-containing protein n=1 Tax=Asticcacaulis sp. YBE204 TaxID=1282363 RepID=UPI0003C3E163|nr:cupin domain-containing protein [Asticcacaulis sp. YBE204]ESQ79761.1 hypothetical protein AEYBE204_07915 [Asticcacaulis sp. YBE204]